MAVCFSCFFFLVPGSRLILNWKISHLSEFEQQKHVFTVKESRTSFKTAHLTRGFSFSFCHFTKSPPKCFTSVSPGRDYICQCFEANVCVLLHSHWWLSEPVICLSVLATNDSFSVRRMSAFLLPQIKSRFLSLFDLNHISRCLFDIISLCKCSVVIWGLFFWLSKTSSL